MPLVPHNPFRELEKFFGDWPEVWEGDLDRTPRVDVYEKEGNIVAEFELPGMRPENIDVEVKNDMIKVEARADEKKDEKKEGYYRKEIKRGYYKRVIPLSLDVLDDKANAEYENGVLKVTIPKAEPKKEKEKGKKVKVKGK